MSSYEKDPFERDHAEAMAKYERDMKNYKPSPEFLKQKTKADITAAAVAAVENEFKELETYFSFVYSHWMAVYQKGKKRGNEIQEELWRMWSISKDKKKTKKKEFF